MRKLLLLSYLGMACFTCDTLAQSVSTATPKGTEGGASAVWIFATLSFTGMHAQAKGSLFWRVVSFIFGFPGTLLTLIIVPRGSERAYGVDMPRKPYGIEPPKP
jgi:hypothetical protein